MMHASATPYSSLPGQPTVNALPYGIPTGPWQHAYRAAPGAQLPAVRYPGMMGAGFGDVPGVTIQGFGAGNAANGLGTLLLGSIIAAGYGAVLAMTIGSGNPVRNTALLSGGLALGGGLLNMAMAKKNGAAAAA